jgi:hypothetical protein
MKQKRCNDDAKDAMMMQKRNAYYPATEQQDNIYE